MRAHDIAADELRAALETAGTKKGAGRLLGVSEGVVARLVLKYGITMPRVRRGDSLPLPESEKLTEYEAERQALAYLQAKGYELDRHVACDNRHFEVNPSNFDGETQAIGVVSDTHLGSRFQQLTLLESAYTYFYDTGVDTVLHAGDVGAGNGTMYRGQRFEVFVQSADERLAYIRDHYPRREGITTYIISGNHDHSDLKHQGQNLVKAVCDERDDLVYMGMSGAYVDLHGISVYLMHSCGGVSYARSYKMQKLIEQMSPDNKPQVAIFGHWHITCELPMYRNVYGWMAGCFESQTPYELEKGLYPEVGFAVFELTSRPGSCLVSVRKEWFPLYEPIPNDF